jgi:hypothetical protein
MVEERRGRSMLRPYMNCSPDGAKAKSGKDLDYVSLQLGYELEQS